MDQYSTCRNGTTVVCGECVLIRPAVLYNGFKCHGSGNNNNNNNNNKKKPRRF